MTSYFLLLAGLTSFRLKRCLSHLSAIGPAGILESKITFDVLLFVLTVLALVGVFFFFMAILL